jgi:hypothetical protein
MIGGARADRGTLDSLRSCLRLGASLQWHLEAARPQMRLRLAIDQKPSRM